MQLKIPVSSQDHSQGPESAPVTLVEYGDYQCPHCGRAHPVVKRLQKHFGASLRFVFRNFPLSEMHPMAVSAAEAAEFAASHDKFWEMHDGIFEHQSQLSPDLLTKLARQAGLDAEALAGALRTGEFRERVKSDFRGGVRSGVNGTPTFFINGNRHDAPPEYQSLATAISELIS
jgi:protein-disulfide isomerase